MSDALMDLHAHYKAVRARLNAGPPKPPPKPPEAAPAPLPVVAPLTELSHSLQPSVLLSGLRGFPELKDKILPILEKHRIEWRDVCCKSQKWKYTKCRFEVFVKLNAHGWSLSQIGRLCNRDHTTVLNGIKRFIKENLTEEEIAMARDCGMRPVDYYEAKVYLKEIGRM